MFAAVCDNSSGNPFGPIFVESAGMNHLESQAVRNGEEIYDDKTQYLTVRLSVQGQLTSPNTTEEGFMRTYRL